MQGRFEILSLSGSFTFSENGSLKRTGRLSVSLAGPDGRVIGGAIAGTLIAANPIQVRVSLCLTVKDLTLVYTLYMKVNSVAHPKSKSNARCKIPLVIAIIWHQKVLGAKIKLALQC